MVWGNVKLSRLAAVWLFCGLMQVPSAGPEPQEVQFESSDGTRVYADLYRSQSGQEAPVLLLFHQGDSNAEEYAPIAPLLNELGFHCLAVDTRNGGSELGGVNRTIAPFEDNGNASQAVLDFRAALQWLREEGFSGPVTLWGSSFSGGRIFQLAAEKIEGLVAAVAFSPAGVFAPWGPNVEIPVFITWAPFELNDRRRSYFDQFASRSKVLFEQKAGVHGSASVHPRFNPEGWEENFAAVLAFLDEHSRTGPH